MSEPRQVLDTGTVTFTENAWEERRRTDRVQIALPLRLRPCDSKDGEFDEVCESRDASRDGVYFTTASKHYRKGMQLFVTFPYSTASHARNVEFVGRVVRVEELPEDRTGVALDLLMTLQNKKKVRSYRP